MASQGWKRSGTQLLNDESADIPNVNKTSATIVPIRPQSTLTLATPTAVARLRNRSRTSSTHGGSAFRNREGAMGVEIALRSIWTTLAWTRTILSLTESAEKEPSRTLPKLT